MDKSSLKVVDLASFWNPEAGGQLVIPDRSLLIGQKLVENTKIEKFKWGFLNGQKLIKIPNTNWFGVFWKLEACYLKVLPDRSILIEQKLVENTKN